MKTLEGKWALVTGSTRGIGQQIAKGLAERNCNVVIHGREESNAEKTLQLLEGKKVKTEVVAGDLAWDAEINQMIEQVKSKVGQIDILYNNAAIQSKEKSIWERSMEEWKRSFQINFFALVEITRSLAPAMVENNFGRIINLTSGIQGQPELAPYGATKKAVDKFTQDLAAEFEGTNVLANTLDPGWLKTDLGGEDAFHEVETVLPGALVPALLDKEGPSGKMFEAQNYKYI